MEASIEQRKRASRIEAYAAERILVCTIINFSLR